jgi:hypothetical protein
VVVWRGGGDKLKGRGGRKEPKEGTFVFETRFLENTKPKPDKKSYV